MSFSIDEILRKAKEVAVTTGKVVGEAMDDVVDSSKVKLAETKVCGQIKEATHRLGATVYESYKTGKDSEALQLMIVDELNGLHEALEELKKDIPFGTKVVCEKCGGDNHATASFCMSCGAPIVTIREKDDYVVSADVDVTEEIPVVQVEVVDIDIEE